MTGDQEKLLAVFEVRLHDLISLCEEHKKKTEVLMQQIKTLEESNLRAEQKIQVLNTKYTDLLTAHIVSSEEGDTKHVRMRLNKLVREVERCIALLNG
ncbi:MAG: hypothetical protein LBE79_04715 [Tannerella sp.]|jgi:hypothetical protein|nr:hypothetical protein [Tannerella sp.]